MSSYLNSNINQNCIVNMKTVHFYMSINVDGITYDKDTDLTLNNYGNLDFVPDAVYVKYIGFQSQHANTHDDLLYLDCNFINENTTLCPFAPKSTIQSFHNLRYTCKQNLDINSVKFSIRAINLGEEAIPSVQSGSVLCGLEFVRYKRYYD